MLSYGGVCVVKVTVEVRGHTELQAKLKRAPERLGWGLKKAALEDIEQVMAQSQEQVPIETGALKGSAYISQDSKGNITFGYGGKNVQTNPITGQLTTEYMAAVHERLDLVHPVGRAKFLERPINNYKRRLKRSLTNRVKQYYNFER